MASIGVPAPQTKSKQAWLAHLPVPRTLGYVDAGRTAAQYVNIVTCAGRLSGALHGEEGYSNAIAS